MITTLYYYYYYYRRDNYWYYYYFVFAASLTRVRKSVRKPPEVFFFTLLDKRYRFFLSSHGNIVSQSSLEKQCFFVCFIFIFYSRGRKTVGRYNSYYGSRSISIFDNRHHITINAYLPIVRTCKCVCEICTLCFFLRRKQQHYIRDGVINSRKVSFFRQITILNARTVLYYRQVV